MRVLIAEDDQHTRAGLREILEQEGYEVTEASNGDDALACFRSQGADVLCLDIMMPGTNGYDVCRAVRRHDQHTPILFISAKSEEIDKVLGLEIGADDYIVKPFGVKEVVARIRAVVRRSHAVSGDASEASFDMDDLHIVPSELRAYRSDVAIDLGPRDVKILQLLHAHQGRVLQRDQIFDFCWGQDYMPNSRTLDQHISQLRKKIERDPKQPAIIRTVHGAGYRYE